MNSETSIIDSLEIYSFLKGLQGGAANTLPKINIDQFKYGNIVVSEPIISDTSPMTTTVSITQEPIKHRSSIIIYIMYAILIYGVYFYFIISPRLNKKMNQISKLDKKEIKKLDKKEIKKLNKKMNQIKKLEKKGK
jgi:hypothetical protein